MSYTPSMVKAQVLYSNVLRTDGASVTYSATPVVGFEPINAYDWRDFTLFQPAAASTLVVDAGASAMIADTCCVWWSGTGTNTVLVEYWTGSAWATAGTIYQASIAAGGLAWIDFTSASATKWRLTFSGTNQIRQACVGLKLQFPIGQWDALSPSVLMQGVVMENVISVNGSIIGRNQRRLEKTATLLLDYLDPAWVRTYWEAMVAEVVFHAFFWRWDPVTHPTEVAFAVADSITAPLNMQPPPLMHAEMPLKFLTQ